MILEPDSLRVMDFERRNTVSSWKQYCSQMQAASTEDRRREEGGLAGPAGPA